MESATDGDPPTSAGPSRSTEPPEATRWADGVRVAIEDRLGELGLTKGELARRAGVDSSTLSTLLHGKHWPHPRTLSAIESALGWPTGTLRRYRADQPPDPKKLAPLLTAYDHWRAHREHLLTRDGELDHPDGPSSPIEWRDSDAAAADLLHTLVRALRE